MPSIRSFFRETCVPPLERRLLLKVLRSPPSIHFSQSSRSDDTKVSPKSSSKKHFCTLCPKSFVRPAELSRHVRTHTNERPFACPVCKEKFKRNDHLKSHLSKHTQKKEHKCQVCEYETNRRDTLKRHIKNKHKKEFLQIAKLEKL